jgi:hypothetical protein
MNFQRSNLDPDDLSRVKSFDPEWRNEFWNKTKTGWNALLNALLLLALGVTAVSASGQQFEINWFTIDGGGGTSTGGAYTLSGTIGQPDAGRMSGGNHILAGGFWSVQQTGLPPLNLKQRSGNLVLSWPADASGVVVQSATQLARDRTEWAVFTGNPVRVGDEFELVIGPAITPPNPIRFFRLHRP